MADDGCTRCLLQSWITRNAGDPNVPEPYGYLVVDIGLEEGDRITPLRVRVDDVVIFAIDVHGRVTVDMPAAHRAAEFVIASMLDARQRGGELGPDEWGGHWDGDVGG